LECSTKLGQNLTARRFSVKSSMPFPSRSFSSPGTRAKEAGRRVEAAAQFGLGRIGLSRPVTLGEAHPAKKAAHKPKKQQPESRFKHKGLAAPAKNLRAPFPFFSALFAFSFFTPPVFAGWKTDCQRMVIKR